MGFMNFVIVKRENDDWWLGRIKDIEGKKFLVDFMSASVAAEWIHSRHIWPYREVSHLFRQPQKTADFPAALPVAQVATRDIAHSPYVIRPGHLLWVPHCFYFFPLHNRVDEAGTVRCNVVHRYQIIYLPHPNEPPFHEKSCGHWAHVAPVTPIHLVYIRADNDTVTFIYYERYQYTRTHGSLVREDKVLLQDGLDRFRDIYLTGITIVHLPTDSTLPVPLETSCIHDLPIHLVEDIFRLLDVLSQFAARQVCSFWRALLDAPAIKRDVIVEAPRILFDIPLDTIPVEDERRAYKFAVLLENSTTIQTRTLVCCSTLWTSSALARIIVHMLRLKEIVVDVLVIKGGDMVPLYISFTTGTPTSYECTCPILAKYLPVCRQLIVVDLKFECILQDKQSPNRSFLDSLYEKMGIRYYSRHTSHLSWPLHNLTVSCGVSGGQLVQTILLAMENACLPAKQTVVDKFTATYARMVRVLKYPKDWDFVRIILQVYNEFQPDGSADKWSGVDPRELKVSSFTKLTIHALIPY
ncbi:uncharacterized protein LOC129584753 [Paramacrobiotus metropolitanus]|uniref:uncharacterized protein LOC129584753 n=1 Tax=Paramacrobiotus metropolitanus TaxID=2943436 RepID=UPI002445CB0E|nr:uncharacterized protein LOC129584753 [Paramacrobiotus metropolitanus]